MNLYRVISEELGVVDPILDDGTGPVEYGRIAHLVAAETPSRAKYAAWRTDVGPLSFRTFVHSGDIREMPKFSVVRVRKDLDIPAGIYSDDGRFADCWGSEEEAREHEGA